LWGVVHGIRTFVPLLLQQGSEAHIVNTASIAGLVSTPGLGVYNVTKHGVVTLSETLYQELQQTGAPVHVSVLCPGWVNTRIHQAERNRPPALRNQLTGSTDPSVARIDQTMEQAIQNGLPPEGIATQVFAAIRERRFYILTHPPFQKLVQRRMAAILAGSNPDDAHFA
jgi:NAD(P)-dependent dehydrogenase (short-subunit alcohol dehydrogenase family)